MLALTGVQVVFSSMLSVLGDYNHDKLLMMPCSDHYAQVRR